ncbi:MAG: HupE/UreJ family protein [Pseudomonadales bacterium]|nr:HupE/UreJ family protein [Pseudomonadales bacterium]
MKLAYSLLLSVLWGALIFFTHEVTAHEGRPVFVEVRAIKSAIKSTDSSHPQYILRWKTPPVFPPGTEPHVSLKRPECWEAATNTNQIISQKLIGSRHYRCQASELTVKISYPDVNPALSSLVVFYDREGVGNHIYSGPDTLSIPLNQDLDILEIASQYVVGGMMHILLGWDHLCFIFCLIILARSLSRLMITITGFTLAHTVTLIGSALNIFTVPILFIEVLIALSIVLLAAEIVRYKKNNDHTSLTHQYPIFAATILGLLHGFGFASVLTDLPPNIKLTALLFFNLGIEFGQLIFICGLLFLAHLFTKITTKLTIKESVLVRNQERILASSLYLVGITASYWVAERFLTLL